MAKIVVSGALANKPHSGGEAWVRMSWVNGFRRLGHQVYFIEQIASGSNEAAQYFRGVVDGVGISRLSLLLDTETGATLHGSFDDAMEATENCDLLVNISGHLTHPMLLYRCARRVYIDIDPGFTQFWQAQRVKGFHVSGHDAYYTIGENIGTPRCPEIPTCDIAWRPIRQPVVLDDWPVTPARDVNRFTTIASWRGAFGRIKVGAQVFGAKAHEFRKFIDLPRHVPQKLEIALDIHEGDQKDRQQLESNGWSLVDPRAAANTPARFREYVQQSAGEFSVAQGIYVETNCGWFSDRTIRYLASGKPVLVQETGFSDHLPVGEGLLSFRTMDDAIRGANAIDADYPKHCRAARDIAERYFDSRTILTRLLDEMNA
ncbi:MAG TPA: hypothetical protein VL282_02530 [Tepidisphaeraceae bacterium]|jgi:hypothetical protein|nr:hypothetical protein [Tepidisphaeraceae bacterium]